MGKMGKCEDKHPSVIVDRWRGVFFDVAQMDQKKLMRANPCQVTIQPIEIALPRISLCCTQINENLAMFGLHQQIDDRIHKSPVVILPYELSICDGTFEPCGAKKRSW